MPSPSRCRLVPFLARSVGFLPVRTPQKRRGCSGCPRSSAPSRCPLPARPAGAGRAAASSRRRAAANAAAAAGRSCRSRSPSPAAASPRGCRSAGRRRCRSGRRGHRQAVGRVGQAGPRGEEAGVGRPPTAHPAQEAEPWRTSSQRRLLPVCIRRAIFVRVSYPLLPTPVRIHAPRVLPGHLYLADHGRQGAARSLGAVLMDAAGRPRSLAAA